ncbi:exosortase K [Niabella pedocola]|uniref:Exosortase K n=1 Tax=Niabella pedocola TaxID=1752077 RepID=A0ABS8Q1R8_9BACT|nr:exosortase K [Niabella pedocola]MCD2426156.1 exosortase K [Niabella pedocola]
MSIKQKMLLTVAGSLILILLKLLLRQSDADDLYFLLAPVSAIIEATGNYHAQFISGAGFFFRDLHVIINKSCSGATFMLTALLPAGYLLLSYSRNVKSFFKTFPIALLFVYFLTILANTTRILTAIKLGGTSFLMGHIAPEKLHELLGMITYLFYLISAFLLTEKLLQLKSRKYAHPA